MVEVTHWKVKKALRSSASLLGIRTSLMRTFVRDTGHFIMLCFIMSEFEDLDIPFSFRECCDSGIECTCV